MGNLLSRKKKGWLAVLANSFLRIRMDMVVPNRPAGPKWLTVGELDLHIASDFELRLRPSSKMFLETPPRGQCWTNCVARFPVRKRSFKGRRLHRHNSEADAKDGKSGSCTSKQSVSRFELWFGIPIPCLLDVVRPR